jgi:DNA-directed RNA polymerase subunit RPC12/RpoP
MKLPECCGMEMLIATELGRFVEAKCQKCGDVIFVKSRAKMKPQLIDD